MRIVCPSCNAAYDVPDSVVAARRMLRCSRCNTDFAAHAADGPPAPAPAPPAAELRIGEAERFAVPSDDGPAAGPARLVLAAWALSLVVIAVAAWAAIAWRAPIMRAWPPSTRVYAALGYVH